MKMLKNFLCLFLIIYAGSTLAQSRHQSTEQEFIGRWKVLPFPIEQQPPESRNSPLFKGACNYFLHEADGTWSLINIQNLAGESETIKQCELSYKQLDTHKAVAGPSKLRWKRDGKIFLVSDPSGLGYVWSVLVVDADGDATFADPKGPTVVMRRGNLLMQLANPKMNGVAWRVLLSRVPE